MSFYEDIVRITNELLPETDCIRLDFTNEKCSLFSSKAGGVPYYPKSMAYPTGSGDCEGMVLRFLAQLNFEELPHIPGFPEKGILQFFISNDLDMSMPSAGELHSGYKVVYHRDIITDTALLYSKKDLPKWKDIFDEFPVKKEYKIIGKASKSKPTMDDFRFEEAVIQYLKENTGVSISSLYDLYNKSTKEYDPIRKFIGSEDALDKLWLINRDEDSDIPSQIGGYPSFSQADPRHRYHEGHTVTLFQFGSVYDDDNNVYIEWGDGGEANFFIAEKALKELDFSEVLYNWDCG